MSQTLSESVSSPSSVVSPSQHERVCAVVVTFNRKELLRGCLAALQSQQRPVDHILVVDNASTDGTNELVRAEFPAVEILSLSENLGGAGGFHEGMKHAFEADFDWFWLMDDDGIANPDCLQLMMQKAEPGAVVLPVQQGKHGLHGILGWRGGNYLDLDVQTRVPIIPREAKKGRGVQLLFTFVGPLISRAIVERVGLPHRDFFIWFDDFEYAFRIRRYMKPRFIVVPDAVFHHDPAIAWREVRLLGVGKPKQRRTWATWRAYYMARNSFYTLLRTRGRLREILLFLAGQVRFLLAVLLYDPDRWPRAGAQLRGLMDGALGRMGRRH